MAFGFSIPEGAKAALYCDIHKETGSLLWTFNIQIKNKTQLFIFNGFLKNNNENNLFQLRKAETKSKLQLPAPLDYSNLIKIL